jgi:hypothetical protein
MGLMGRMGPMGRMPVHRRSKVPLVPSVLSVPFFSQAIKFFEKLTNANLTGEKIIFKPHDGVNYFLTISLHSEPDEIVLNRLKIFCLEEFPFINS